MQLFYFNDYLQQGAETWMPAQFKFMDIYNSVLSYKIIIYESI